MIVERSTAFRRKCRALDNAEKEQRMNIGFSVIVFAKESKIDTFSEMPEVLHKGNKLLSWSEFIAPCDEPRLERNGILDMMGIRMVMIFYVFDQQSVIVGPFRVEIANYWGIMCRPLFCQNHSPFIIQNSFAYLNPTYSFMLFVRSSKIGG